MDSVRIGVPVGAPLAALGGKKPGGASGDGWALPGFFPALTGAFDASARQQDLSTCSRIPTPKSHTMQLISVKHRKPRHPGARIPGKRSGLP